MTSRTQVTLRYLTRQKARTFFVVATYMATVAVTFLLTSAVVGNEQTFVTEANNLAVNWIYAAPDTPPLFPLTEKDAGAIAHSVPDLTAVAPILEDGLLVPAWGNQVFVITGTNTSLPKIFAYSLSVGSFNVSSPANLTTGTLPLVVGHDLWTDFDLSVGETLSGSVVRVNDLGGAGSAVPVSFVITGLLAPRGSIGSINLDAAAFVSVQALENITGSVALTYIFASAASPGAVNASTQDIQSLLTQRHGGHQDFSVQNQGGEVQYILNEVNQFSSIISLVEATLLLLSAFSIFVVMTMAVKDRRREIGVMRALGATRGDIMGQFLLESGIMSVTGIALGVGFGTEVAIDLKAHATGLYAQLLTSPLALGWYFAELLLVLWAVGFLFSLAPAYQASRLEAVEALRSA